MEEQNEGAIERKNGCIIRKQRTGMRQSEEETESGKIGLSLGACKHDSVDAHEPSLESERSAR